MGPRTSRNAVRAGIATAFVAIAVATAQTTSLPSVPYPAENSPSEAKRVLGKMLFFEEQLSSDNTVACATCHVMSHGGTDPRRRRVAPTKFTTNPAFGSPGVRSMAADGGYRRTDFRLAPQVTPRATPSPFASDYATNLLWDGRADSTFVDPVTDQTIVQTGGALEHQSLLPMVNVDEMGHAQRTFPEIVEKVQRVTPLALADHLPQDLLAALVGEPGYPELFRRAFGDEEVTAPRIALAIATYERTLLPDRTDYDRLLAGDETALTETEKRGLAAFKRVGCAECHALPLFTDNSFRATGVGPIRADGGRAGVTQSALDGGKFKVPSLRNVALKSSFFHDGERTTLRDAVKFYARQDQKETARGVQFLLMDSAGQPTFTEPGGETGDGTVGYGDPGEEDPTQVQFTENQDPLMSTIHLTTQEIDDITAFLQGGLVDGRVQDETAPFDRPTLASEHPDLQATVPGVETTSDPVGQPEIVFTSPAVAGTDEFRVVVTGVSEPYGGVLIATPDGGTSTQNPPAVLGLPTGEDPSVQTLTVGLADIAAGTNLQLTWGIVPPGATEPATLSPFVEVPVVAPRSAALDHGAARREPANPATVDDRDAYVVRASFRVNWAAHAAGVGLDGFTAVARVNPRGAGPDLSQGRVTVWVGDVPLVERAPLDAAGRFQLPLASGSFDRLTGLFRVRSVASLDLREVLGATRSGARGKADVPVVFTLEGLGLATPSVAADVPFAWRRTEPNTAVGRYEFERAGAQRGTFQLLHSEVGIPVDRGVALSFRARWSGPGGDPVDVGRGLTIRIGSQFRVEVTPDMLVSLHHGRTIVANDRGLMDWNLRVNRDARTLEFADVSVDDPSLRDVPSGSVVPLRIRLEPVGGASFETTLDAKIQ